MNIRSTAGMIALAILLLGLAGCSLFSPVPRASIQYLESLPEGGLQRANAQDVRVAINLPEGVKVRKPALDITGEYKDETIAAKLPLRAVLPGMALASAPSGGSGNWTYYYALTKREVRGEAATRHSE